MGRAKSASEKRLHCLVRDAMSQVSYLAMALGVLNLLLVASGFLLVYFDWSAARRREFLYLYFTEEKPGFNYFAAARRRRAQYTRLLAAFFALFLREFLVAVQYASVSKPQDWAAWVQWWGANWWGDTFRYTAATAFAADLQIWILCLGMLGLVLLGLAFLYRPQPDRIAPVDWIALAFVAAWLLLVFLIVSHNLGPRALAVAHIIAALTRFITVAGVVYYSLRDRDVPVAQGMLNYYGGLIALAFA
jgi:hypothetical protein